MPAFVAHLLIAKKTMDTIKDDKDLKPLYAELLPNQSYVLLGALGPDLPYYGLSSLKEFLTQELLEETFFNDLPEGVDQWSYQLHSKQPNFFPLILFELIYRDNKINNRTEWDKGFLSKLKAFTCGYLTHMAADQRIHPLVNDIAGPYYLHAENRKEHRNCEVHQDVYLYSEIMPGKEFGHEDFLSWIQTGFGMDNEIGDSFAAYMQKAFVEVHGVTPDAETIRKWVTGVEEFAAHLNNRKFLLTMPHAKVWENFNPSNKNSDQDYVRYFQSPSYIPEYFDKAVDIAIAYFKAASDYCAHMEQRPERYENIRENFWEKILRADLLSPLEDVYGIISSSGGK